MDMLIKNEREEIGFPSLGLRKCDSIFYVKRSAKCETMNDIFLKPSCKQRGFTLRHLNLPTHDSKVFVFNLRLSS